MSVFRWALCQCVSCGCLAGHDAGAEAEAVAGGHLVVGRREQVRVGAGDVEARNGVVVGVEGLAGGVGLDASERQPPGGHGLHGVEGALGDRVEVGGVLEELLVGAALAVAVVLLDRGHEVDEAEVLRDLGQRVGLEGSALLDVAFPAALAAVYLSTLFSGPGASLPVLLFDVAYAIILAIVGLEPLHGARGLGVSVWLCAGFLAYKAGWYVGVLTLATLRVPWLATATTVCALAALMALTVVQFVARSRERQQEGPVAAPAERDYFALACAKVQDDFGLTAREMDVFGLLARGRTSAYIQKALSISDGTARPHISHIYKKLGASPSRPFSTSWRRR